MLTLVTFQPLLGRQDVRSFRKIAAPKVILSVRYICILTSFANSNGNFSSFCALACTGYFFPATLLPLSFRESYSQHIATCTERPLAEIGLGRAALGTHRAPRNSRSESAPVLG